MPKTVVRRVRRRVPLGLRENTASPIASEVQTWKGKHIWLKSDFGITAFVWAEVSPSVLPADGGLIKHDTMFRTESPGFLLWRVAPKWPLFKAHMTHKQSGGSLWTSSQQSQKYHYSDWSVARIFFLCKVHPLQDLPSLLPSVWKHYRAFLLLKNKMKTI